jgi:predicted amidophosphoribosyltransferase
VRVRSLLPGLAVCSALDFSGVPARVLRAFKEDGRTGLARPLGGALAAAVARVEGAGADVAIVPVPSSRRAFRRRGYETSALLARRGGLEPLRALSSRGAVADQRGLGREARAQNVAGTLRARGVAGCPSSSSTTC